MANGFRASRIRALLGALATVISGVSLAAPGPTYVDEQGVIRWHGSNKEVSLFGANYCLPSALDYRAAGYMNADRKLLIRQDMAHFARMGFDAVRLSFWGDWENSDRSGNLVANDHLDLLDFLIAEGTRRGMYFLLSPIVTYDARWPEMGDTPEDQGFSRYYSRSALGLDPDAIRAEQNYLRQLLNHVNPYSGRAIKDEPNLAFVEPINEPWHHPETDQGSIGYIDSLVSAVRDTGCDRPIFHNLSQDFRMGTPILRSKADGMSFGWYPSGLVANHQQFGNFLPFVDEYRPMRAPELAKKPKIVYEFDMPDVMSGYHYPAMVRSFRQVGAQWASMFTYDMLATAPLNLGWQTHVLNLVYTPQKAVSAVIAGEVMRRQPRGGRLQPYPQGCSFGPFSVSYNRNVSLLNAPDAYMNSNDSDARPVSPRSLRRVVGFGSSPLVSTTGTGSYFLDRISPGVWRLEVYPDAIQISDPFHHPEIGKVQFLTRSAVVRLGVHLPDLGEQFWVKGMDAGNLLAIRASHRGFRVGPGVYLLSRDLTAAAGLPAVVERMGLLEFVCPSDQGRVGLLARMPFQIRTSGEAKVQVTAVGRSDSVRVRMVWEQPGQTGRRSMEMRRRGAYRYEAVMPTQQLHKGPLRYCFSVLDGAGGKPIYFSGSADSSLTGSAKPDMAAGIAEVVDAASPLKLFRAAQDAELFDVTRSRDARQAAGRQVQGPNGAWAVRIEPPGASRREFAASLYVGDRVLCSGAQGAEGSLAVWVRAAIPGSRVHLVLVDSEGAAWGSLVCPEREWKRFSIDLKTLRPCGWALLPEGYPGEWNVWHEAVAGGSKLDLRRVERLQVLFRPEEQVVAHPAIELCSIGLVPAGAR